MHQLMGYPKIDQLAFARNTLAINDLEFCVSERRGDLVFDDLDTSFVTHHFIAILDGADATDIQTHRGIEFKRIPACRGFGTAKHDANLHANLVDEDDQGVRSLDVGGQFA